mgnify:CR=1 FL=1
MERIAFQIPEHPEGARAYLNTLREIFKAYPSDPNQLPEILERKVAEAEGSAYACAFQSTSTALKVFFEFHGIGKGHQVLCPTYMPIEYVHAILRSGATPIFIDLVADRFEPSLPSAIRGITEKTRALVLFYPYGIPCDPSAFQRLCKDHDLRFVEVVPGGLGSSYRDKALGTHGDAGILEFHPKRASFTGEGGFVVTDDEGFSRFARKWLLSRTVIETEPETPKKRISDFHAAIGIWHVDRLREADVRRARVVRAYEDPLRSVPGIQLPSLHPKGHACHRFYPILVEGERRNRVRDLLTKCGIETAIGYAPAHLNTFVEALLRPPRLHFSESIHEKTLLLPIYPTLTPIEQEYVVETLVSALGTFPYQSRLEVYA